MNIGSGSAYLLAHDRRHLEIEIEDGEFELVSVKCD